MTALILRATSILKGRTYSFFPFLAWRSQVNRFSTKKDMVAGLVGALVVLPQGVAFATIAGLPPEYGLYSAIVPAVIAALWGSSWHLVSGPTTAISLVVFASLSPLAEVGSATYVQLAVTLSFLVGVIQLVMGSMRLGILVNFISHTVVIGFTAGAAILIASNQLKNFFGIAIAQGSSFYATWNVFFHSIGSINWFVATVAILTVLVGVAVKKWAPKIPYMLPAMLVGSLAGLWLNTHFGQAVTGIKTVSALPGALPPLSLPTLSMDSLRLLAPSALAITMLALTEAVAIARAIALKSGQRIDGNQEFSGQGLSNVVGGFFSAYPSSGSFNRSGLNYEAGARTPLASVYASVALVVILMFVGSLATYLPLAVMAAVLFLVAWGLIDFHHIHLIFKASRSESGLLVVTFLATLFLELQFAVLLGVFFSVALYLRHASRPAVARFTSEVSLQEARSGSEAPRLEIVRINGSLFFASVGHIESRLHNLGVYATKNTSLLILCSGIAFIDLAGADMLANEARRLRKNGGELYLANVHEGVVEVLESGGHLEFIRKENIFSSQREAIDTFKARNAHRFSCI